MKSKTKKRTDSELINEIRLGGAERESAWRYIFSEWRGYYLKPVFKSGGNVEEVNEVLGIVFHDIELQLCKPDFELREATLATYLTTAVYRAWAVFKKRKTQSLKTVPEEYGLLVSSDEDAERKMLLKEVIQRAESMGDPCRTILFKKGEGYSNEELAALLNFSVQHIKNMAVECRKKLINLIGGKKYY